MKILFFFMCALFGIFAFTAHQARMARKILANRNCIPPFSRVVDAVLKDQIAFTLPDTKTVYVDGDRLESTPTTFHNVIVHETSHLCGSVHGDGSLAMNYAVHLFQNGSVMDDERRILFPK